MKKLFYILSFAAVAAFTAVSCVKEEAKIDPANNPAEDPNCYGVYFPTQDASGDHVFSPKDDPVIEITVARTNDKGDISVPLKGVYSEADIFVPENISFADGQSETTFKVRFDAAKEGVKYEAHFTIEGDDYASLYNSNPVGIDFSVMRVEMLTFKTSDGSKTASITCTDKDFWGECHDDITIQYYEVDGVRYCETLGGKLKEFYGSAGTEGAGPWGTDVQMKFKWYTKKTVTVGDSDYQWIEVEAQPMGWESSGNPVYFGDYFHMRADMGLSNGNYTDSYDRYVNGSDGYLPSYYDGNGGFVFNMAVWIHGTTSWYGYQNNAPLAVAEGYVRVDYSFSLDTDYSSEGVTPVFIETGVDISSVKYAVYEGELTATQANNKVEEIMADKEAAVVTEFTVDEDAAVKYATLLLSPEATGIYTLVAVAYGNEAGKDPVAQASDYIAFNHIAAEDVETYAVDIHVFAEPTPARYTSLTEYDSFAFGVYGSDITESHIAIVEASSVKENTWDALKENSKYAVSDDVIAQINAEGGFYDVASGLDDGVQYAVLVWATNGYEEEYAYALFTTTELPEVWKAIGKGSWTDDFFTTFYKVEPQTMEVDVEQSEDDPTRFRAIYPYDAKYPYNEEGDWDTSKSYDLVVSIPDATHVFILPQKIGVDWGYGNVTIASVAGRYVAAGYSIEEIEAEGIKFGKFENGEVTFPEEKTLLIQLPDYSSNFYYANSNNAFKFVIPTGGAAASSAAAGISFPKPYGLNGEGLIAAPELKHIFERDPKPVTVAAEVSNIRKEKSYSSKTISEVR